MFKVGQVWRNNAYGTLYVVCDVRFSTMAIVQAITGHDAGWRGNLGPATARKAFTLIGNNYQERAATKTEKPAMKQSHTSKLVLRGGSLRQDGRFWYSEDTIKQIATEAGIEVQP